MKNVPSEELRRCWKQLGILEAAVSARGLQLFPEATDLEVAEATASGREFMLIPSAARAWRSMKAAARSDSVQIFILSAHRSIESQVGIIRRKLESGQKIDEILSAIAPPGCSEHHTGRAVDIGTDHSEPLQMEFEQTPAFKWLLKRAPDFGFALSFPEGNEWGYIYEPWHWCFSGTAAQASRQSA